MAMPVIWDKVSAAETPGSLVGESCNVDLGDVGETCIAVASGSPAEVAGAPARRDQIKAIPEARARRRRRKTKRQKFITPHTLPRRFEK